ncbi:MAG TPA: hypothetical protein VHA74_00485 [Candidatus Dojkabacteria bacterium]|nr:hypothetical protein [Candidatus Dojkabacteria bacterium]
MPVPTYFKYDLSHLSKSDRDTVKILEKVGKIIHKIWLKQVDRKNGVGFFYPSDMSKEELMEAAKKNQKLLSPYTIVKRDKNRKLYAVDYKDEYRKEHESISILLQQAIKTTEDKKLREYLTSVDTHFKKGEFNKVLEAFLKNPNTKVEIIIGPIESYTDHLMDIKRSYQYSLRILREDETNAVKKMSEVIRKLGILRPNGSIAAKLKPDSIRFRIDDVYMFAGRQAGSLPSSTNLPNQPELVQKYGLKIVVYHNSLMQKYETRVKPLLKYIKGVDVARKNNEILEANYRVRILHEIAEGVVKYVGMEKRLGENFDIARELNAEIFGVRSAKYHLFNGLITTDEYNYTLIAFIAHAINTIHKSENEPSLKVYAKGLFMAFNYFIANKALVLKAGNVIINPEKLSESIDVFSDMVLAILAKGDSQDVTTMMRKWGDTKFISKLPKIK